ncbi:MAG: selenide, water dikinase SelD [Leptospiraceae bacterium]|nr:selenide, water dikinase SelD [Leptospiraceae bacterium]
MIRLTEFSPGAGCGCKISPAQLETILQSGATQLKIPALLVGNDSRDDAAVFDLGNGTAVISTTDFFTPIVDDPFEFGRIAAVNAISDVYAMGGRPLMAIAILGWPLDKLSTDIGQQVVEGGRQACASAGIVIAGGHSIDISDPIFGLAVTGQVAISNLKRNDTARAGCRLYLTKAIGVGIITTAEKRNIVHPEHRKLALESMNTLNSIGSELAALPGVTAMTDVTGFGLLGHLLEMCNGSKVNARLRFGDVPLIPGVQQYVEQDSFPGGTRRNWGSYGHQVLLPEVSPEEQERMRNILCDPQTSGGLLVAVQPEAEAQFLELTRTYGLDLKALGELEPADNGSIYVRVDI